MAKYYGIVPAANVTTNATANTETDHLRLLTVANQNEVWVMSVLMVGKAAGAASLSGITGRLKRFSTASTSGTAITPAPMDPANPAASTTAFTAPTVGATATYLKSFGCSVGGPGGWIAEDNSSGCRLAPNGGTNGNLDFVSSSATVSLNFEYALSFTEGE